MPERGPQWFITVCEECRRQVTRRQVASSPWPHLFVYWCPEHGCLRTGDVVQIEMVPKDPLGVLIDTQKARLAELEAALGKAWRLAEEIRDGGYKPEGIALAAAQICRDAEQVLTEGGK